MKRILGLTLAISIGSITLHCASPHSGGGNGNGDGGLVDGADAANGSGTSGTCCTTPAPTFTNLAEGDLPVNISETAATVVTPAVPVGNYSELVVGYTVTGSCNTTVPSTLFQEPSSTVFIATNQSFGRIRVDGPTAELSIYVYAPCTATLHYVIAGVN